LIDHLRISYLNREQQESVKKRRFPFRISVPKPAKITITPSTSGLQQKNHPTSGNVEQGVVDLAASS